MTCDYFCPCEQRCQLMRFFIVDDNWMGMEDRRKDTDSAEPKY